MALLNLKTDLKSLKYGQDQPGGGSSGQPYQQVDINRVDTGFNRFRMTKFDDGLVRGGVVGAANASIVDTFRIGKFLKDFPKGPLFIVKQVGLQLSNPRIETSKTGRGNVGKIGPTRIYNLGINTLAQIPVNAFGIHFNRHGLLPVQDDQTKYLAVAQANDEVGTNGKDNRLVGIAKRFELLNLDPRRQIYSENISLEEARRRNRDQNRDQRRLIRVLNQQSPGYKPLEFKKTKLDTKTLIVDRYVGGPGSVYGIGQTIIPRRSNTEDYFRINSAKIKKYNAENLPKIANTFDFGISLLTTSSLASSDFELILGSANLNVEQSFFDNKGSVEDINKYSRDKFSKVKSTTLDTSLALASSKMWRIPSSFTGVSNYSSSIFNTNVVGQSILFPRLTSTDDPKFKPPTLANYTASYLDGFKESYREKAKSVYVFGDLGLSREYSYSLLSDPSSNPISDNNIPVDGEAYNKIFTSLNQNAVNYSNPSLKTYFELRNKVDETTTIEQNTPGKVFTTQVLNLPGKTGRDIAAALNSSFNRTNDINVDEDTLALRFVPLDPFTGQPLPSCSGLNFLGYLNEFSETYNSSWGDVKYVGRSEKFYIFNEFSRTVQVGFNIPCFNPSELKTKHKQLSELASVLAGKYNNPGPDNSNGALLGGIITKLKLGNYIDNQPGIITNLTFSPIQDSSWDLDEQLAFYLKVSFGFTVIHNFLPQYYPCGFIYKNPDPEVPKKEDTKPKTEDTGSIPTGSLPGGNRPRVTLPELEIPRLRNRAVNTYVKPPFIIDPDKLKKKRAEFRGFGGGNFGGSGAGGEF